LARGVVSWQEINAKSERQGKTPRQAEPAAAAEFAALR
jgi:hypothetical protein